MTKQLTFDYRANHRVTCRPLNNISSKNIYLERSIVKVVIKLGGQCNQTRPITPIDPGAVANEIYEILPFFRRIRVSGASTFYSSTHIGRSRRHMFSSVPYMW